MLSMLICSALLYCLCSAAWRPTEFFVEANTHINISHIMKPNFTVIDNRQPLTCGKASSLGKSFDDHKNLIIQMVTLFDFSMPKF